MKPIHLFLGLLTLTACGGRIVTESPVISDNSPVEDAKRHVPVWEKLTGRDKAAVAMTSASSNLPHAELLAEKWDSLPHPKFWKEVMTTSKDTVLINHADSRKILARMSTAKWHAKSGAQKRAYRANLRKEYGLNSNATIYVTTGKSDFYALEEMIPEIEKATKIFAKEGADPFYAQAILLIESPGKAKRSNAGAHGSFQLMPYVARANGLRVNRRVDERKDFDKSAMAAARFIKKTVVPETKKILDDMKLDYDEEDTWFRLVVLHSYHAGPGNVRGVLRKIRPREGGQELIQQMWTNTYRGFQNASQNYSQLALAALLRLNDHVERTGEVIDLDVAS